MDTRDEHTVRTLLRAIASTPEPPAAVDLTAARRRGSRRLWIRRAALPALALVALAVALTVPRSLVFNHSERTLTTPRPPASSPVADAPWQFDPLVPYASFGWLPPDFSESAANAIYLNQGVTSATDFVSREAAAPAAGHLLYLQVNARGTCPVFAAGAQADIRARGTDQVTCTDDSFAVTGTAPDINGRPAFWTDHGSGVVWEYAPGAWAELSAAITPAAGGPHSRRYAAEAGWVTHPRPGVPAASVSGGAALEAGIRDGKVLLPSAATEELLLKVAARVVYGGSTPLAFPFRLTGGLPAGWRLRQAGFAVSGGRMLGTSITAGPAADTSAFSIGASTAAAQGGCDFVTGQSSYVTRLGLQWIYRVLSEPDKNWQRLCATGPVDGLTGVSIAMDMNVPGFSTPLPGAATLGGTQGVLTRLRLLGPNPNSWTTSPLG